MFTRILLASDGSDCAIEAARLAAELVQRLNATLIVLNVFNPPTTYVMTGAGEMAAGFDVVKLDGIAREAKDAVARRTGVALQRIDSRYTFRQEIGHPVEAIVRVAEMERCDLVVMGSRGTSRFTALRLGSVVSGVLHHVHCPVLVVRKAAQAAPASAESSDRSSIRKVLMATDGSTDALKAAEAAAALATAFGATVETLHVHDIEQDYPTDLGAIYMAKDPALTELAALQSGESILARTAETFRRYGVPCTSREVKGHPAESIVHHALSEQVDLIVVGCRGRGWFTRLLMGSVSDGVVNYAHNSVLVVK